MDARLIRLHDGYDLQDRRNGKHPSRRKVRLRGRLARRADKRDATRQIAEQS